MAAVPSLTATDLKCKRCLIVMVPPIYRCDSMHSYCEDCELDDPVCTQCTPPQPIMFKNRYLEAESKGESHRCRWNELCGMFLYHELRPHEIFCSSRQYKCPACSVSGSIDTIMHHIRSVHPTFEIIQSNCCIKSEKVNCTWLMVIYDEIFVCEFTIEPSILAWSVRLSSGRMWRARQFDVFVYTQKSLLRAQILSRLPCFQLELVNTKIGSDFEYTVSVMPPSQDIAMILN